MDPDEVKILSPLAELLKRLLFCFYLKRKEITVSVFVNTEGEVDSVAIYPDMKDSFYKREIIRRAYGWCFEPAKRAGKAVAVWWSYEWKL